MKQSETIFANIHEIYFDMKHAKRKIMTSILSIKIYKCYHLNIFISLIHRKTLFLLRKYFISIW